MKKKNNNLSNNNNKKHLLIINYNCDISNDDFFLSFF